ncbi:MAG: hypothetical protein ACYTKD_25360 [Planctomycetota bacterium]
MADSGAIAVRLVTGQAFHAATILPALAVALCSCLPSPNVVAFSYGAVASARSEVGTGTGTTAFVGIGTHFLCTDLNIGIRYEQIEGDEGSRRRVTAGNQGLSPANDLLGGNAPENCGTVFVAGFSYDWSENDDAWGVGPVFGVGGYIGHHRRFMLAAYGTIHLSLGADDKGFDVEVEATATIEATAMF